MERRRRPILSIAVKSLVGFPNWFSVLTLLFLAWPANAAPSKLLSYQGRVTDANGQPIADGTYTLRFKIYSTLADCNADGAPNLIWGPETHDGGAGNPAQVQVTNGLFSAVLGTDVDTPLSQSFDVDYWLQVKVGVNPVFTPCDRLTTAPYAINAINADSCNTDATCETAALTTTGNATIGGDLTVNGTDVDLIRGDTSYIHSVGRISFDWTAGTYDTPDNHGITSKNEAGSFADALRINSYADVIVTIDSNANSVSYFKVQKESVGDGTDLLSIDESGNMTILGTVTAPTFSGSATNLSCTDCLSATQIQDLYVFNTGDSMTGNLNMDSGSVIDFSDELGDRLMLYGGAGVATSYGLGIEASTLYAKANGNHRWYISENADAGVSENMELDTDSLNFNSKEAIRYSDSWLRLNEANSFTSGTYTPYLIRADTGFQVDGNQVIDDGAGWHRTWGSTGWYNSTYGGGWYMTDTTYVRAYNNKAVRSDNGFYQGTTPICTLVDIPDVGSGTQDTQCPIGWKVAAYYARGSGYYCGGAVSHNAGWTDGYVRGYCSSHSPNCVGANLNAGDNCFYGNLLCCWAS